MRQYLIPGVVIVGLLFVWLWARGSKRVESFVGSTLQDSDPAYAPTRVLLAWPRRRDRG